MRSLLIAAFALSVVSTALGQSAQPRPPDQSWVAPAEASARTNPLANRPDTAAGGRKVFAQRCGQCHGDAGRGSGGRPGLTTTGATRQTDGGRFWKIRGG